MNLPPITSWQVYHAARKTLGMALIVKIYKKSPTQIYRWSRDPICEDIERNPIDWICDMLSKLCEIGKESVARAGVKIMAEAVGCELVLKPESIEPDQDTVEGELLDDYPALLAFHTAIREGDPNEAVKARMHHAIDELRETFYKCVQDRK